MGVWQSYMLHSGLGYYFVLQKLFEDIRIGRLDEIFVLLKHQLDLAIACCAISYELFDRFRHPRLDTHELHLKIQFDF